MRSGLIGLVLAIMLAGPAAAAETVTAIAGTESHLDPLTAVPARNRFLQTVVPFLRKLRASTP